MSVYESLSETQQFACRVIADHARATAFAIADGILPGNEGRNYVLRKIMRRAIYHGREHLGYTDPFFFKVCDFVVDQMHEAYPELEVQRDFIGKMVRLEEERFGNTLTTGLKKLEEITKDYFDRTKKTAIDRVNRSYPNLLGDDEFGVLPPVTVSELTARRKYWRAKYLEGQYPTLSDDISYRSFEDAYISKWAWEIEDPKNIRELISELAKLYDTFGTPKDLIFISLRDNGFDVAEVEFDKEFDEAIRNFQENSQVGKTRQNDKINPIYVALERTSVRSKFHGYETTDLDDAEVIALVKDDRRVEHLNEGEEGLIVLCDTPFYAEAGGQVGDTGFLITVPPPANAGGSALDVRVQVIDTFAPIAGIILHKSKVERGSIKVGDKVIATVNVQKRDATRRNHTATHLVHAALREVLGTHVKQAGSVVAPNYLRFDFTHYQPMTEAELTEIEDLVNQYILENHPVNTNVMAIEEAMRGGAMALFGEKYGSDVRVLSVGDGVFSKELCGGTHVRATGDIGSFKITSDEAIASGVRRIRAITGFDAFERFREDERLIDRSLGALKTQRDNLPSAIEKLQEELKRTRKENDELKLKIATGTVGEASSNGDEAREVAGIKVLGKIVEGLDANGTRQLSDTLLSRMKSGVVVLGRKDDGKVSIIVRVSDDLTGKIKAGNVIKEIIPIVGGRGGGKPDMAEGGGSEPDKLAEAIDASYKVIETFLTG
ncbi:MAG: alanine--tRNA ligase-related protein [Pyrinomonadaceae bacterium]